jgi:hypothetical protein
VDVPQHVPADVGKHHRAVGQYFLEIAAPSGRREWNGDRGA